MSITVNPFSSLGIQHKAGLDYVIQCVSGGSSSSSTALPPVKPTVTIDQLVQCTVNYINTVYGTSLNSISNLELSIIIQDAINGYVNAKAGGGLNYTSQQAFFIHQLLEGIHGVPSYGIKQYIEGIEENIVQSGMSSTHQNQLLMATAIGKANFDYLAEIAVDEGSYHLWEPFTNAIAFGSGMLVSFEVSAAMEATLFAERHRSNSTVLNVSSTNGANAVAALAASIALVAGVIIFQWVQKPARPPKTLSNVSSAGMAIPISNGSNFGLPPGVPAPPAGLFENSGGCGCS